MEILKKTIKARRDELHMTNQQIADAMGYVKKTIEQWVCGKNTPCLQDALRLCVVLQCSPNYLLGWEESK